MAPLTMRVVAALLLVAPSWVGASKLNAGAHTRRIVELDSRATGLVTPSTLPGTWTYYGCYTDPGPRTLTGSNFAGPTMTDESCIAFCDTNNYIFAGTEYADECYCGNSTTGGQVAADPSTCSAPCAGNSTEACGGNNRLTVFWNGETPPAGPSTNPGTQGYGFFGCYTEGTNGRALTNQVTVAGGAGKTSVALCIAACKAKGYSLAGVEFADECYCDNTIQNQAIVAPEGLAGCNKLCAGNSSEYCGAGNRLDIYKSGYSGSSSTVTSVTVPPSSVADAPTSAVSTVAPPDGTTTATAVVQGTTVASTLAVKPTVSPYSYLGCYTEATTGRALSGNVFYDYTLMTLEECATSCAGFTYFGVEYGGECYCGNTINAGSVKTGDSDCSFTCPGNQYEYCGAGNRLDMYILSSKSGSSSVVTTASVVTSVLVTTTGAQTTPTGPVTVQSVGNYVFNGCWTEGTGTRALSGANFAYDTMTVESCAASCAGWTYFGVEYGRECYCGTALDKTSTSAPAGDCSQLCAGSAFEYCGNGNRLDVYVLNGTVTSSSTTGTQTATSSSSPSAVATAIPAGWKYDGCYTEGTNGRALSYQQPGGNTNTVESCINTCIGLGYTVAGMEYSSQCFCDNYLYNGAAPTTQSKCNMPCAGNSKEMCGAGDILSVYNTGNLTVFQPPTSQTTGLPDSWTYQGCYSDNINDVRALYWQVILTNNNTATHCLNLCSEYGYMAGGVEYGDECYCGDSAALIASGSTKQAESDCQIACSGDKTYFCGGNSRLSYYTWTGTPLNVFHTPTGNAAGNYEFLIGGVVVPLITTTGINNKVTFMEKSGTGAPNTTGAYELDLTEIDNFSMAWRPMHVKTDIFCSASVTLPDKGGRQLNIGGWAGASTYGVRIYWPDGSDGVWGTHDWQENVNELSLLEGRWYPSAMVLTNGSVLVMGGEVGSNSAPTPSCEILPRPPGGYAKYLDWLDRTDPNNLYPFMFILPSGGIFVVYYNEARVLDEGTFDTVKTLPNLPGSVNNFLSGRTYPLEGTAVLLPQFYPFSDPVTVLVCGGSANGNGQAVDNCVSTQPEVTSPTWVIERMPSQRVMSCMAALPDGTYLILNGAQAGVAGFGLATNPNYQALLYDPSQPVNQRISILGTTPVARLYHSEAMLIPDGRVMVSGSDPEDGTHPEEYRVEVYNPPYALNGFTKPSYNSLSNADKDWAYGGSITVTAVIPSGSLGGVRVSMLAAVSSTHGNSMGQRTLFLQVGCTGSSTAASCTITAPPTKHVAPPGWYMIFILDGPTPSVGQWVRIGGSIADAAALGNWPAYSDFITPGLGAVGS